MANFSDSLNVILYHEGGYANNPADPGGETKYGISKKQYPDLDIAGLTPQQAGEIYRRDYWIPNRINEITNQDIANAVMDAVVNHGKGVSIVQEAANRSGADLTVDNIIGSKTIAALNSVNPDAFLSNYVAVRKGYYDSLIQSDPALAEFRTGWYKRASFFLPHGQIPGTTLAIAAIVITAIWLFGRKKA